jgi:hypothetical protein
VELVAHDEEMLWLKFGWLILVRTQDWMDQFEAVYCAVCSCIVTDGRSAPPWWTVRPLLSGAEQLALMVNCY